MVFLADSENPSGTLFLNQCFFFIKKKHFLPRILQKEYNGFRHNHLDSKNVQVYLKKESGNSDIYNFNDTSVLPSEFTPTANTYMIFYHVKYEQHINK